MLAHLLARLFSWLNSVCARCTVCTRSVVIGGKEVVFISRV